MLEAYRNYYIAMWNLFKETWWLGLGLIVVAFVIFIFANNRQGR